MDEDEAEVVGTESEEGLAVRLARSGSGEVGGVM